MDREAIRCLLLKLDARRGLTGEDAEALAGLFEGQARYAPGEEIADAGSLQTSCRLLLSGMTLAKRWVAAERQQITEIHVPGDIIDLSGLIKPQLGYSLTAASQVRIALVSHERLRRGLAEDARLAGLVLLNTVIDAAVHREWIASSGRRSALERVAGLFCELYMRLSLVGLVKTGRYPLPLTQAQLGDACGISTIHVNRVLHELRARQAIELRGRELLVRDFPRLCQIALYDPDYLLLRDPGKLAGVRATTN